MELKGQMTESFIKKLQDMGLFQANNFGDNFQGLGKSVDMTKETNNMMGANEGSSDVMEFLKRKGMMNGNGSY